MQRAAALGLLAIYQFAEVAEEGGFVAYGPRVLALYGETVARQLVKLLRGAKPADPPVEQPTQFGLVIAMVSPLASRSASSRFRQRHRRAGRHTRSSLPSWPVAEGRLELAQAWPALATAGAVIAMAVRATQILSRYVAVRASRLGALANQRPFRVMQGDLSRSKSTNRCVGAVDCQDFAIDPSKNGHR
jgi:hypothetical protein